MAANFFSGSSQEESISKIRAIIINMGLILKFKLENQGWKAT
jgi:hypothetical protein